MRVYSRRTLREFWERHPDAQQALQAWYINVKHANWKTPSDIKITNQTASFLPNNRVVFNIRGNTYRVVVIVAYLNGSVYIRFVGTHSQYNRIDANTI
jgi:mRNA interferase HigB